MKTLERTLVRILFAALPVVACSKSEKPPCWDCEPDEICVQDKCSPRGTAQVEAAIGSEREQLGVTTGDEAAAFAPSSLAVNSRGGVWLLDQVNRRLKLFEGNTVKKELELDSSTYRDMVLLRDDRIVLMDNLVEQELVVVDLEGNVLERVPLFGPELDEPQLTSGMESRGDGVWVGYSNRMVRVLTKEGEADLDRPIVYGHLSVDGRDVVSLETQDTMLQLFKRKRTGPISATKVTHTFERPITNIGEVHSDSAGKLYMICNHYGDEGAPERRLLVFDTNLLLVRSTLIPPEDGTGTAEIFRMMDVTKAGEVYVLRVGKSDVKVRRF